MVLMSKFGRHLNLINSKSDSAYRFRFSSIYIYIYIYQTLLSKATYSAFRLYICFVSMCVPWESNPQLLRC